MISVHLESGSKKKADKASGASKASGAAASSSPAPSSVRGKKGGRAAKGKKAKKTKFNSAILSDVEDDDDDELVSGLRHEAERLQAEGAGPAATNGPRSPATSSPAPTASPAAQAPMSPAGTDGAESDGVVTNQPTKRRRVVVDSDEE